MPLSAARFPVTVPRTRAALVGASRALGLLAGLLGAAGLAMVFAAYLRPGLILDLGGLMLLCGFR